MASSKSYQQMQSELDEVMVELQSPDLDIEEALKLYKQGQKLVKDLEDFLKTAQNEVKKLTKS